MAQIPWLYTMIPFDTATKNSFRKMNVIASDHHAKLAAYQNKTGITALYTFFHPLYLKFSHDYSKWLTLRRAYNHATQGFTELLNQLSGELAERWDSMVIVEYPSKSKDYS